MRTLLQRLRIGAAILALFPGVLLAAPSASVPASTSEAEHLAHALNEQGVALALAGRVASAESTFVLLLSQHRGDPRAYNNLGNLSLMKGYYAVALAYYDSALRNDSTDAGVHLNRAAVHLLLGEEDEAVRQAALASQLAGGADRAGELLGLHADAPDSGRAAEKKVLTQADMRALLKKASKAVPAGKPAPQQGSSDERGQGRRTPVWRAGTTRASQPADDAADAATVLYWKR